ncbi:MAG: hypothetical protein KatS3mg031_0520 [Chitinophagales bacterium]|nr:MAG: hypothetical protein KatS3mg031_0520 [Chitinophagales bacterium]
MKENKTIKALANLTRQEMKWFCEWVHSDYFNKHDKLRVLTRIIAHAHPHFDDKDFTKEKVFKKLFPSEKYHPQKLSDLLTYLYRLYEKFLVQLIREEDEAQFRLDLLRAYRSRNAGRAFLKTLGRARGIVMQSNLTEEVFLHEYFIERESDLYFSSRDSRTTDKSIERKTLSLDLFYLSAKLKSCCEMINRQNIIRENYDIRMLDEIKSYISHNLSLFEKYPLIRIYYQILLTLQESEREEHYFRLVELLEHYSKQIDHDDLRQMYDYAQNYCIKKINSGHTAYLQEIFKLYKTLLAKKLLFDANGNISQWDYKNIVTAGTRIGAYTWCEEFVHAYREKLPAADRDNAYAFNLATLYYSQKKFDKALRLLQTVKFTDVYYELSARSLLLKTFYESDEMETLYALFDSFKIYLKRNKLVSKYQFTVHMNLIRMTRRLARIKAMLPYTRKETVSRELEKLKKKIKDTPEITNLNWLLEMVADLEAGLAVNAR